MNLTHLETFDPKTQDLNVVVETPKGSRNKFDYDEDKELFTLAAVLPEGMTFPYEFGFIPSTRGEDGDPLDIMVLMDTATFTGCMLTARLIGVVEASQRDDKKTVRNDRLIAVASHAHIHGEVKSLDQLSTKMIDEIEHFFTSYNQLRGTTFKPLGRFGPKRAAKLIKEGRKIFAAK